MKIYTKNNPESFEFFSIELLLPYIGKIANIDKYDHVKYRGFNVDLTTKILYVTCDDNYTTFRISIFGFGVLITNQKGY
jgi:hypothetical protein